MNDDKEVKVSHLHSAWSLILSVHSDHSERIHLVVRRDIHLIPMFDCDTRSYLARVEALDDDAVLVELVLGLHPLRFALFSGQGTDYGLTFLRVKESLYCRKKERRNVCCKENSREFTRKCFIL